MGMSEAADSSQWQRFQLLVAFYTAWEHLGLLPWLLHPVHAKKSA